MSTCKVCQSENNEIRLSGIRDWEFGVPGIYSYQSCQDCGVSQLEPFPKLEDLKRAYPDDYPAFVQTVKSRGWLYQILYRLMVGRQLSPLRKFVDENSRILDVGCGNGELLSNFRRFGVSQLFGIDFHPTAIQICRSKGIKGYQGVFMEYEAPSQLFQAIIMNNYIEHVLSPVDELKKAYQLLQPGGVLFGELPNFAGWDRMVFGKYWGGLHVPRHTFQYTPHSLRKLLSSVGFGEIKITQQLNPGHLVLSLQSMLNEHFPWLRERFPVRHGRASYFSLLLIAMLPLQLAFKIFARSGTMHFIGVKPDGC